MKRQMCRERFAGERGSATIEFVIVVIGIVMPLVYITLAVAAVHGARSAASHGVREAARVLMEADASGAGLARARQAVDMAFADHGLDVPVDALTVTCTSAPCLMPGSSVNVGVSWSMPLPWMPQILHAAAVWPIQEQFSLHVDDFRSDPL
ncbi:MAG: hypothetical protein RJB01_525 [Actinomycetota bacterium]